MATDDRFTALQSGEIDVLVRNTTWTASRDGTEGATFLHPTFYDGQGMMVAADSGFACIEDMDGAIVCVAAGHHDRGQRRRRGRPPRRDWEVPPVRRPRPDPGGVHRRPVRRLVVATSASSPGCARPIPDGPEALTILPTRCSPRSRSARPSRRRPQWAQAVELGGLRHDPRRGVRHHLGERRRDAPSRRPQHPSLPRRRGGATTAAVLDPGLGLPPDFAYQVISQVGQLRRDLRAATCPARARAGLNALWTDGGLLYAPPYR